MPHVSAFTRKLIEFMYLFPKESLIWAAIFKTGLLSALRPKLYNVYLYPSYNHTVSGMNINQKDLSCNYIPYMGEVLYAGKREATSLSLHLFEATSGQPRADSSNWALSLLWANTAMVAPHECQGLQPHVG